MIAATFVSVVTAFVAPLLAVLPAQQPVRGPSLSIRVLDAQSKQPIPEFRVVPGSFRSETYVWQAHLLRVGQNGQLEWPAGRGYDVMAFRVEADGYKTQQSQRLARNNLPDELEFLMEADVGTRGWILQPDGEPASGARLVFALPGRTINIHDGKLRSELGPVPSSPVDQWREPAVVKADATGRFECPDENDPSCMVLVMHDSGVREMPFADLKKQPKITLQPWGRIAGRAMWGEIVGKDALINLIVFRHDNKYPGMIEQYAEVRTNDEGRFAFEKVLPGNAQVAKMVPLTAEPGFTAMTVPNMTANVTVKPGGTTPAVIGGQGRTVRGRFTGRDDWTGVTYSIDEIGRDMHIGFPGDKAQAEGSIKFQMSDVGRQYSRNGLKPNADGTFEIPRVLPANYQLIVLADGGKELVGSTRFAVEAETPGEAPPPQDLKEVALVRPAAAASMPKGTPFLPNETKTEVAAPTPKGDERDGNKLPEVIAEAAWGKPVDGLRLALVPVRNTAPLNEAVEFQLVVENVSDKDITFTTSDLGQQAVPSLLRADGQAIETRRSQFRAGVRVLPTTLKPGARTAVARPSVMGVAKAEDGALKYGCTKAIVGGLANDAGIEVHVQYSAKLGSVANGGKFLTLESGDAKITVGKR